MGKRLKGGMSQMESEGNTCGDWYWNSQNPQRSWTKDVKDNVVDEEDDDEKRRWASLGRRALCRWMKENP